MLNSKLDYDPVDSVEEPLVGYSTRRQEKWKVMLFWIIYAFPVISAIILFVLVADLRGSVGDTTV
jgi:hypothetical protein